LVTAGSCLGVHDPFCTLSVQKLFSQYCFIFIAID
jgi:hypothetical protein